MHLAQASVYARIGMEKLLKDFRSVGKDNVFNYTNIGDMTPPTKPDIFTRGY